MAKSKKEHGVPSKMQLVRNAITALGADAKPLAIQNHVKENGGIDLPSGMISSYKSMIQKKDGAPSKRSSNVSSGGTGGGHGTFSIDDLERIQALINSVGAPQLLKLVHALTR